MKCINAHLLYFSPTGTTRTILKNIALGMGIEKTTEINLTRPQTRQEPLPTLNNEILLVGMPVYEDRIPPLVRPILENLHGLGQYAIVVAVYGNVGYGAVLQELETLLTKKDFNVIAGAAFIGEHSFSHAEFPIASKRPDDSDKYTAREFGRQIAEKLSAPPVTSLTFPGHLQLMSYLLPEGSAAGFAHPPNFDPARCNHCGRCANSCPVGAIYPVSMAVNDSKCLRCFACVRVCPQNARSIQLKHAWLVKRVLKNAATHRQEPQLFL